MAKKRAETRRAMQLGATALSVLPPALHDTVVPLARGVGMTVNGLLVEGKPSLEVMEKVGLKLRVQERGAQFALGDFINRVEALYGEEAAQVIDHESGWSDASVSIYRWIAERVQAPQRRMDRLGIRHHLLVAGFTAEKQAHWLTLAANDEGDKPWTVKELAAAIGGSEDALPDAYWVIVKALDSSDQSALMAMLESQGRTVKALQKRAKKHAPAETS